MLSLDRLNAIFESCSQVTIGLVGDLYLDRYLEIEPTLHELSIETGLEAYQVAKVRNSPGALGTVINNLAALGAGRLIPITVIGDDGHGYELLQVMEMMSIDSSYIVRDSERLTPTYIKPMRQDKAGDWSELNRLDVRSRQVVSKESCHSLGNQLRRAFDTCDGLVVVDHVPNQDLGVIDTRLRSMLSELSLERPDKLIFIDSRAHLGCFDFGVLKGNRREVCAAAGLSGEFPEQATEELSERTGRAAFCTLGEKGIVVARPNSTPQLVPTCAVNGPIDIVGAGDSAAAGIVISLLSGADELEAATVGNLVASITVQQLGATGTASPAQVRRAFDDWTKTQGG